jgi:hypothetical protein
MLIHPETPRRSPSNGSASIVAVEIVRVRTPGGASKLSFDASYCQVTTLLQPFPCDYLTNPYPGFKYRNHGCARIRFFNRVGKQDNLVFWGYSHVVDP